MLSARFHTSRFAPDNVGNHDHQVHLPGVQPASSGIHMYATQAQHRHSGGTGKQAHFRVDRNLFFAISALALFLSLSWNLYLHTLPTSLTLKPHLSWIRAAQNSNTATTTETLTMEISYLREKVENLERQLYRLPRDGIGSQDFAFRYNGGVVIDSLTTASSNSNDNPPSYALDDDTRPGRCWLIRGNSGQLAVSLPYPVQVTHITIDHIARELVADTKTAPRKILLWAVEKHHSQKRPRVPPSSTIGPPLRSGRTFVLIGEAEYDIQQPNSTFQTFPVFSNITNSRFAVKEVVADISDNWGGPSTCLYRLRVHGFVAQADQSTLI